MDILSMIRDDVSTPLVTHDTTSWKVGQGDSDVSESIVDSSVGSITIKGQTYQNILPSPSLRNGMTNGKTMQKLNEGYDEVKVVDGEFKNATLKGQTKYKDIDNGEILDEFDAERNPELVSVRMPDLTPGGTNPTTKPYVWDGGHIQLSSEEGSLTPSLEYSVTTSRGGQIIQNTQSIAKQDKRVYDLEMLLINASIDEAYKRLTLQNDVMVMNRECQTVASPLRYIMLQRLIEEKAYETQDMLDKLDVFFMYGEITDEQYFELFDIVLGIMTDTDLDITEEVE